MSTYDHSKIEPKWRNRWFEENIYKAVDFSEKPKQYILAEFPYPSGGSLHAGHMMRYTVPDVYARYLRMRGYNVLFPMGWDAFGLPAEDFAIRTGVHPEITTKEAVKNYKESMLKMGYGIDWDREIDTADPSYYKWTQWLFLKFWEEGLAEYKEMPVWWCEELRTVLAEEEVLTDENGNKISERRGFPVERRMFKQWVLKIPNYANKLIEGLNEVGFSEAIKNAQINWIGRSDGAYVKFDVSDTFMETFTTRADTIYGVTFLAIAPEHAVLDTLVSKSANAKEIKAYIQKAKNKTDLERQTNKEKAGVQLQGIFARHPFTGKNLPVFVADYVLMDYGTGVVMGVPAHDDRDFEFANKYGLEILEVIHGPNNEKLPYTGEGTAVNSDKYNGMGSEKFREKAIKDLEDTNKGRKATTYKIRDWIFSRQRYWGEPIPLIHRKDGKVEALCNTNNPKEVEETLPLELPEVPDYNPTSDGISPLAKNKKWVKTKAKDGTPAERETNTMPNWAGSCWYYMRYADPQNNAAFADYEKLNYWLPVDKYFGGAEHTTMHLLYSRFWHRLFYDLELVPTKEPYTWRMNGGLLLGPDGKKMSKSRGNVVEPMDVVESYGADALRMYICFLGPYTDTYPWRETGIKSTWRLMKRVYELRNKVAENIKDTQITKAYHKMVQNVTRMFENLKMNTAVSEIMIFVNATKSVNKLDLEIWKNFIKVLAPFAPFIAEELWQEVNNYKKWNPKNSVHLQPWPIYDESLAKEDSLIIPVQINGKVRGEIEVEENESEESVKEKALPFAKGKEIKNAVYVPGKIINLVI